MTELDVSALIAGTKEPEPTNSEMMRLHAEADAVEHAQALVDAGVIDPLLPSAPIITEPIDQLAILMERIAPVDVVSPHLKLFVYGFYGSGKTVFEATGECKTLIVDMEDGSKAIRNHPNLKANVDVLPFRSVGQVDLLITGIENDDPRLDKYELFAFDSATAFQQLMTTEHIKREALRDSSRSKYLPGDGDQYLLSNMMRDFLTRLKSLKRHVIVTALAQEIKEESTGRMLIRPELTPKVSTHVGALFDMVGYLSSTSTSDGKFANTLQIVPGEKVAAKTRIGGLPPIIENPTFNGILQAFNSNGRN